MSSEQFSAFSPQQESAVAQAAPTAAEDLTGRDRMAWNVLASWAGHFVFIVAGFILPRFIDRHIGQTALGVWDFGWSLVSYFSLAQVGIGSAVNRFVARYRGVGDMERLNGLVSTVFLIQLGVAVLVIGITAVVGAAVPALWGERLGFYAGEARWVVLLLGTGLAVQMACDAFVGVITGCHRWDLHNFLNAGFYAVTAAAMILSLLLGGGLRSLAAVNVCGTVLSELVRVAVAFRICPGLRIHRRLATWEHARDALSFGGKTVLNSISRVLLYQTNSLLIVSYLGPGSLALFTRPRALVAHAQTLVGKFSFVLTPTASSLQAAGSRAELQGLLVRASQWGAFLALPMVLVLTILGDPILQIWMGSNYRQGVVLAILALGHLAEMARQPAISILTGMNLHGRVAAVNLAAAAVAVGLGILLIGPLRAGLIGAALAIAIPLVLVNGIFIPIYACRQLELPLGRFLVNVGRTPGLCALPLAVWLLGVRFWVPGVRLSLVIGGVGMAVITGLLYWRFALTVAQRARVTSYIARRLRAPMTVDNRSTPSAQGEHA